MRLQRIKLAAQYRQTETSYMEAQRIGMTAPGLVPRKLILASGSSPHPGMMSAEFISILLALLKLPETGIVCESSNAGRAQNYLGYPWSPTGPLPKFSLSSQYFPSDVHVQKKQLVSRAFLKLMKYFGLSEARLQRFTFRSIEGSLGDVSIRRTICPELGGKQIGTVFLPRALEIRQGWLQLQYPSGLFMCDISVGDAVSRLGFMFNALAAFRLSATAESPNTGIALRDYSNSRGTVRAMQGIWHNQNVMLTSRLYCDFGLSELVEEICRRPAQFARILQRIELWSNGTEYHICK